MISKKRSPVNEFSPELWERLSTTLRKAASETKGPKIAAFDADGTLWDADAGETFFDWEIHKAGLKNLPADPWAYYESTKKVDPIKAYVWLAQINVGHTLEQVRSWATQCYEEHPDWPVFESQRRLITLLRELDFEIFVVTASIKWAVEPLALRLGIDNDHVLGITTKFVDGKVGMETQHPVTWREGKAEGLLARTGGVRPILASGNTLGDIALIGTATHVHLALTTQVDAGGLFNEELKLAEEADKRGWLRHRFRG